MHAKGALIGGQGRRLIQKLWWTWTWEKPCGLTLDSENVVDLDLGPRVLIRKKGVNLGPPKPPLTPESQVLIIGVALYGGHQ